MPPQLLHVSIYVWLCLPFWALSSLGLLKTSHAKEIPFSTPRGA